MKLEIQEKVKRIAQTDQQKGINVKFKNDENRVRSFSYEVEGLYLDLSKTHLSSELLEAYQDFAEDINFSAARHDLFSGEKINATEDRSVLHTLLRDSNNQGIATKEDGLLAQAEQAKQQFLDQYEQIKAKLDRRETAVTDIIHIGIGGSSLGTQLLFEKYACNWCF